MTHNVINIYFIYYEGVVWDKGDGQERCMIKEGTERWKREEEKRMVEDTDVLNLKPRETLLYIG